MVAASQVVQQMNPFGCWSARAFNPNAETAAASTGDRAVLIDNIVDKEYIPSRDNRDPVPLIAIDRVVDDVVRSAVPVN